MPRSNYPGGLTATIRGVNVEQIFPGETFWVNNSSTLPVGGIAGSNVGVGRGSYKKPFSTLDYAIGRCVAGRGDKIVIMPNHAETLSTVTTAVLDVNGIAIIGLGMGTNRPTFTCSTATDAGFLISANDCLVHNVLFLGGFATLVACVTVTGTDVELSNVEFREIAAGMITAVTVGSTNNDADRLYIHDCTFRMDEVGITNAGDAAIEFGADADNVRIEDNYIIGDFDDAAIFIPAAGDDSENLVIKGNYIENSEATGLFALEITSSGTMTGLVENNTFVTRVDASEVALTDDLVLVGNKSSIGLVGTDYADFPNYTGTGKTQLCKLTSAAMTAGNNYDTGTTDIFVVTGEVAVRIWGDVTTAVTSASNNATLEVGTAGATATLIPQITSGSGAIIDGDVLANATTTVPNDVMDTSFHAISSGQDIIMTIATADFTAGVVDWYCEWYPLAVNSHVIPGTEA